MLGLVKLRRFFPAVVDTWAYSCVAARGNYGHRNCSKDATAEVQAESASPNADIKVNPEFINRNPRNLEFMNIAKKRKGWQLQYPSREFYHRLVMEISHRHITAYVEHSSGHRVVSASTKEYAIAKHLYSSRNVSAAENVGRVLAQRCRECGIGRMMMQIEENAQLSERVNAFQTAMEEGGIEFSEPEVFEPDYEPGIDYDSIPDKEYKRMMGLSPV